MTRRLVPALGLMAALLATSTAEAATKTVVAGPPVEKPPAGVPRDADTNRFYRRTVTIHKGDRVRWEMKGFHTVTFPARGQQPPPLVIPDPTTPVSGVNDAAGAPFWFNGQPRQVFNPLVAFPQGGASVTGRALANSGLPLEQGPPKPYVLRFPNTGTFNYVCVLHPGMNGTVRVVSRRKAIPSAAADRRALRREFAAAVARIKAAARLQEPAGNVVAVGRDSATETLFRFVPATRTVRAGQSITFAMPARSTELHTVSFGPLDYLKALIPNGPIAPDPASPPGGPPTLVLNPMVGFPSDPPPAIPPLRAALHGNGFLSSGLMDSISQSPLPRTVQVTFPEPGTFTYICLIHGEGMKGQVVVTP